ncbi:MAG: preprotein translocase subunit SecG [Deltaproteobacteria bacterium]|nr:preprotein translocase subunit SecG [Deltaproteobacteria bacterium]
MYNLILLLHIAIAVVITLVVLLQVGKGSGMGAAFGGSSESFFGSTGPSNFLEKATIVAGILFVFTSIALSLISGENRKNVLFNQSVPEQTSTIPAQQQPGLPASPPAGQK